MFHDPVPQHYKPETDGQDREVDTHYGSAGDLIPGNIMFIHLYGAPYNIKREWTGEVWQMNSRDRHVLSPTQGVKVITGNIVFLTRR